MPMMFYIPLEQPLGSIVYEPPKNIILFIASQAAPSLVPRPFIGETAWQLTRVQTVYGYDVKEITAPPVQAMNIG